MSNFDDDFDISDAIMLLLLLCAAVLLGFAIIHKNDGQRPQIIRAIDEYSKGNPVVHILGNGVGISFKEGTNSYVIDFTPQEVNYFNRKQQEAKDKANTEKLTEEQKKADILKTVLDQNPLVESYKK